MTKEDRIKELKEFIITSISTSDIKLININVAKRIVSEIYDDFEEEKEKLKKEVDYWKLSFKKQCGATR